MAPNKIWKSQESKGSQKEKLIFPWIFQPIGFSKVNLSTSIQAPTFHTLVESNPLTPHWPEPDSGSMAPWHVASPGDTKRGHHGGENILKRSKQNLDDLTCKLPYCSSNLDKFHVRFYMVLPCFTTNLYISCPICLAKVDRIGLTCHCTNFLSRPPWLPFLRQWFGCKAEKMAMRFFLVPSCFTSVWLYGWDEW